MQRLFLAAAVAAVVALGSAAPASAQVRPVVRNAGAEALRLEMERAIRAEVAQAVQDWVNLLDAGDVDGLARYYAEHARVDWADGRTAHGRAAVQALLAARLGDAARPEVVVADIAPGQALSGVSGRLAYRLAGDDAAHPAEYDFAAVLIKQRGRWLVQRQSFAAASGAAPAREAVRATRERPVPPQRALTRLVVEAGAGSATVPASVGQGGAGVAAGVGVEISQTVEARVHAWRHAASDQWTSSTLTAAGAELRIFAGRGWRVDPHLLLGVSKFLGASAPDTVPVPVLGAGISVRLGETLALQLAARDYLTRRAGEHRGANWFTVPRDQRWGLALGVSAAFGRRPAWTDPELGDDRLRQVAEVQPALFRAIDAWRSAILRGALAEAEEWYAAGIVLIDPAHGTRHGPAALAEYWQAALQRLGNPPVEAREVRTAHGAALVATRWGSGERAVDVDFLLHESGRSWQIRAVHVGHAAGD